MNYRIANKEVCKALIDGEIIRGYDIDEKTVFVTTDGFCGFIIPKKEIVYDIARMKRTKELFNFSDYIKPENEIEPTMHYFKAGKDFCRRFDGKNWHVFVKDKFLQKLDKAECYCFFQNYDEGKDMRKQTILAAVKTYSTKDDDYKYIPVMVLLPISILDYEKSN